MVLPHHLNKQLLEKVRQKMKKYSEDKTHLVHTDNELYFDINYAFSLCGIVPPFLAQKTKRSKVSGIMEWWRDYIDAMTAKG